MSETTEEMISYKIRDYEIETDLQAWDRENKEKYGNNVVSKIVGSGFFQLGYQYISQIVASVDGQEVAVYYFATPPVQWSENE